MFTLKKINTYILHTFFLMKRLPSLPAMESGATRSSKSKAISVATFLADLASIKYAVGCFSKDLKGIFDEIHEYGKSVVTPVEHLYKLDEVKPGLQHLCGPKQLYTGREGQSDHCMNAPGGMSITFEAVTFTYPGKKLKALDDVSFHIASGEVRVASILRASTEAGGSLSRSSASPAVGRAQSLRFCAACTSPMKAVYSSTASTYGTMSQRACECYLTIFAADSCD